MSINLKTSSENLDMEEDEFLEILELFIETSVSSLKKLQSAIDKGEAKKVMMAAHTI